MTPMEIQSALKDIFTKVYKSTPGLWGQCSLTFLTLDLSIAYPEVQLYCKSLINVSTSIFKKSSSSGI